MCAPVDQWIPREHRDCIRYPRLRRGCQHLRMCCGARSQACECNGRAEDTALLYYRRRLLLFVICEIRVGEGTSGGNASTGFIDEHGLEKIDAFRTEIGENGFYAYFGPLREGRLVIWELVHSRPRLLVWCTHHPKDLEDLVNLRVTWEERVSLEEHLCHYRADRPYVDGCRVLPCAKQNFWGSIPQCHDLVCIGV